MTEHTTELPELNETLLDDLVGFLKENPEEHDQSRWGTYPEWKGQPCGTAMCLAGHAVVRAHPTYLVTLTGSLLDRETGDHVGKHVEEVAQRVLGLYRREAHYLFHGEATLKQIERMVDDLKSGLRGVEFAQKWIHRTP